MWHFVIYTPFRFSSNNGKAINPAGLLVLERDRFPLRHDDIKKKLNAQHVVCLAGGRRDAETNVTTEVTERYEVPDSLGGVAARTRLHVSK